MKDKLVLRTCSADGTSRNNFQWNLEIGGITTAPDWKPTTECGNGLHGFLNGEGDGSLADWSEDAIWMVVEPIGQIIDIDGKVKFESAITRFVGNQFEATQYLYEQIGSGSAIVGGTATAGYNGTATAGYNGTATAGHNGTATAGDYGTVTAGDEGTATAGYNGTATAGYNGTATAGDEGTATAGDYGIIVLKYWDGNSNRYKLKVGYIGEDGLKKDVAYELDKNQNFVEKKEN
jgi:hypothetical protein